MYYYNILPKHHCLAIDDNIIEVTIYCNTLVKLNYSAFKIDMI